MLEVHRIGLSAAHGRFLAERGVSRLDCAGAAPLLEGGWSHLSLQFPGEHCTECAAPDCHTTCDLFERGRTGRCKRFGDGIVVRKCAGAPFPYCLEMVFKRWAQLVCVGNTLCLPARWYRRLAWLVPRLGRASYALQGMFRFLPMRAQWRVDDRIRGAGNRLPRLLNRLAASGRGGAARALACVIGNPGPEEVPVELSLSGFADSQGGRSFRRTFRLARGWNRLSVPVAEFAGLIDLKGLFRISLVPLAENPVFLQVLYLGFAGEEAGGRKPEKAAREATKVKLLVTDLDNTLWDGILVEQPAGNAPPLRPGVRDTLRRLDERGILLSIASRNNFEDARRALADLGLWELFLHPKIEWAPKSGMIAGIVGQLNIGMDSVAFVDDAPFEREEVACALPEIRTYDAERFAALAGLPEFDVPVTDESRRRRRLYVEEDRRREEFRGAAVRYDEFLRSCRIVLRLEPLSDANGERVFELVQRTNQLNFSGRNYSREALRDVLAARGVTAAVIRCADRFGDYGIVGFAMLGAAGNALEVRDMMLSCRIQGKQVEHSFAAYLLGLARGAGRAGIRFRFRRTKRNAPAARLFEEMGFAREAPPDAEGAERLGLPCAALDRLPAYPARVEDGIGLERILRG